MKKKWNNLLYVYISNISTICIAFIFYKENLFFYCFSQYKVPFYFECTLKRLETVAGQLG